MPKFNIEGQEKISTSVGFCFSILLFLILTGYAVSRVIILVKADRPDISTINIVNGLQLTELVDLDHFGFEMAFNVEKFDNTGFS